MNKEYEINLSFDKHLAQIEFFHEKGNSLPSGMLYELSGLFTQLDKNEEINLILLKSRGDKAFCAGASFDELLGISDFETGKRYFMGFADLINSMRKCSKFVIARVHGKIVGGGVGLVSACDYVIAAKDASLRLSELALGIGPFVIQPVVERRIGKSAFQSMTISTGWKSAEWALQHSLYDEVYDDIQSLDDAVIKLSSRLSESNPDAISELKKTFWDDAQDWDQLLEERAEINGRLVLSTHTRFFIERFKQSK